MRPISWKLQSYRNVLIPVPSAGPGVCTTCWREVERWPQCFQCNKHCDQARSLADVVTPIALAVKGGQFARELSLYKNGDNRAQATLFNGFATILEYFLRQHETCLASAAQAERFEVVAAVPSTRGRLSHPLHRMLSSNIGRTRARFVPALAPVPGFADRVFTPDRFQVCADVADRNVLLVDDTWTTGSHAQSACAALKDAGAARVGVLVLGRHFEPSTGTARDYLARARSQLFDWDRCCLGQSGRGRCA